MKAIELTEEHKSKLLEMCKVLFPEYKNWDLKLKGEYKNYLIASFELENDYIPDCDLYIHWFEFCMTHLATVIYNKGNYYKNYVTITQFRGYICQEVDHPIDYLYEQFKTLENGKK